jgi:hypothetical protein
VGGKTPGDIDVSGGCIRVVKPTAIEPDVVDDVEEVLLVEVLLVKVLLVEVLLVEVLLVDEVLDVVMSGLQFVVMRSVAS